MRLILWGGSVLAVAACLAMACTALTGVGDLDATGSSGASGGTSGKPSPFGDAKAPPIDAGPPPVCPSAGHGCVKAPPPGWEGPYLLYANDGDAQAAPACPIDMPAAIDVVSGDAGGAFTCECKCGGVTGAKCTAFLDLFSGGGCVDPSVARLDLSTCRSTATESSFRASLDITTKGSCAPAAAFKTKAPAFDTMARLCMRPTGFVANGCAADELCVPDGVVPVEVHSCIGNRDPNATCPAPWTQVRHIYDGVADTRSCDLGTCGCEDPTGTKCSARMKLYTGSTGCQGPGPSYDLPVTNCITAAAGTSQKLTDGPAVSGGSCDPTGEPSADGGVTGTGAQTICCTP